MSNKEKAAGVFAPPATATKELSASSVSPAEKLRKLRAENAMLLSVASEINIAHGLAIQHADKAIGFARQVGELLLKVKAELPHGAFLPWVEAHCTVSPRQAQRYMAASLGKQLPVRAIKPEASKYDAVSHLEVQSGEAIHIKRKIADWMHLGCVFPDSKRPGYFHWIFISWPEGHGGAHCSYTKRSISARAVCLKLKIELPDWNEADLERFPHPGYDCNPFASDNLGGMLAKLGGRDGI